MLSSDPTQNSPRSLEALDAARGSSPKEEILEYLTHPPEALAVDATRLEWIFENFHNIPPIEALPLIEEVIRRCEGGLRRQAFHFLGVVHWYRGDTDAAEVAWRRNLEETRTVRDRSWIRAHNNLALSISDRGGYFEALVLFGGAARLAAELDESPSEVFAHSRRGQMLALLGDQPRATKEFDIADELFDRLPEGEPKEFISSTLLAARARQHRVTHDWAKLVEVQEKRLEILGDLPPLQHPTLVNAHIQRLHALSELEPERGREWIAELEALPKRFEIKDKWVDVWNQEMIRLRFEVARQEGSATEELAEQVFQKVTAGLRGNELVHESARLGSIFGDLGWGRLSKRAFDVAATEVLRRSVEAHSANQEIPELKEATAEDWQILSEYQARLASDQSDLMKTVTGMWRPGHPAFELVVVEELIRLCAWCRRIRTRDDDWMPITGYLPADTSFEVTHAICDRCRKQYFDMD